MAGFSSGFANSLLKLLLQAVGIANVADNALVSPITVVYAAAHVSDPGSGTQADGECSYPGYARVAIARTSAAWVITDNVAQPIYDISFPKSSAIITQIITYISIGVAASGATPMWLSGQLLPNLACSNASQQVVSHNTTLTLV